MPNYYQPIPNGNNVRKAQSGGMLGGQSQYLSAQADDDQYASQQQHQQGDDQRSLQNAMAALKGMFPQGQSQSVQGGGNTGSTPAPTAQITMPDTSAANAASFARAKDQAGEVARGALTGLRSSLGGRGMLGGGLESRGTASVMNQGQKSLADISRQQAVQDSDLAQRTAEMQYQGSITQRGQDIQSQGQQQLAAQRQAEMNQQFQLQQANIIMAALRGGSY